MHECYIPNPASLCMDFYKYTLFLQNKLILTLIDNYSSLKITKVCWVFWKFDKDISLI